MEVKNHRLHQSGGLHGVAFQEAMLHSPGNLGLEGCSLPSQAAGRLPHINPTQPGPRPSLRVWGTALP